MKTALLRLARANLNPERVESLLRTWGDADAVIAAIRHGRVDVPEEARGIVMREPSELEDEMRGVECRFVLREDADFPAWLAVLPDAPRWLFARGAMADGPGVAIVGSRRATRYGLGVAEALGRAVATAGWPVISGLAVGVDGSAHRGSLAAGGSGTAVLGSGIDVWYPARHRSLGEHLLAAGGAVISEFGPGARPEAWRFPCRNRIISGLSGAVVVVEAAERSGALITARMAVEQGREVIAVPGDIDRPTSVGCNLLIRDGAHPLARLDELVEVLERILGPAPNGHGDGSDAAVFGGALGAVPVPIDELAATLGMSASRLLPELCRLELAGRVVMDGGEVRAV